MREPARVLRMRAIDDERERDQRAAPRANRHPPRPIRAEDHLAPPQQRQLGAARISPAGDRRRRGTRRPDRGRARVRARSHVPREASDHRQKRRCTPRSVAGRASANGNSGFHSSDPYANTHQSGSGRLPRERRRERRGERFVGERAPADRPRPCTARACGLPRDRGARASRVRVLASSRQLLQLDSPAAGAWPRSSCRARRLCAAAASARPDCAVWAARASWRASHQAPERKPRFAPLRDREQAVVLALRRGELQAQRHAVGRESDRNSDRREAQQRPQRATRRIAGLREIGRRGCRAPAARRSHRRAPATSVSAAMASSRCASACAYVAALIVRPSSSAALSFADMRRRSRACSAPSSRAPSCNMMRRCTRCASRHRSGNATGVTDAPSRRSWSTTVCTGGALFRAGVDPRKIREPREARRAEPAASPSNAAGPVRSGRRRATRNRRRCARTRPACPASG